MLLLLVEILFLRKTLLLLLLEQQHGAEDGVQLDLQQPVALVHLGGGRGVEKRGLGALRLMLR